MSPAPTRTAGCTATSAAPVKVSAWTVIVAVPTAPPVTRPVGSTAAMLPAELVH
jgi:hypothetical protein